MITNPIKRPVKIANKEELIATLPGLFEIKENNLD